ncbi:MerR family transcriptional regulator [Methylobacterium sp. 17Sr1-1]|uniref:MerR family transcriptional regulator n=1 Tax=Methylobacterium sp. 17Sr1-1 TaxID=2202826 RepID=UPI000D6F75FE|nr:MerR family transcriptional regulator [Methylobacterium sp. 17Sr1-1]AWN51789.1 MerR family transcriptional regulator [Methylobacterium sp. 17Sr1-1]
MPIPSQAAPSYVTIAAAAEQVGEPAHVLRFWQEQFPQIRPLTRAGGRRLYDQTCIELLRGIRHLLRDQGRTIAGAKAFLSQHGIGHVRALGNNAAGSESTGPLDIDGIRRGFDAVAADAIGQGLQELWVAEEMITVGVRRLRHCANRDTIRETLALALEQNGLDGIVHHRGL